MGKILKTLSLIIVIILLGVVLLNNFNRLNYCRGLEDTMLGVSSLIVCLGPSIVLIYLGYIIIQLLKELIGKIERVATAIEKNMETKTVEAEDLSKKTNE